MPILANIIATATIMYAVSPLPNTNAIKRILVIDGGLYLLGVTTVGVVQLSGHTLQLRHMRLLG
jgi:hypothetical protein